MQMNAGLILSGENVGQQVASAQQVPMNAMRMQAMQQEMQGAQQAQKEANAAKLARMVLSSPDPQSAYPRALQAAQFMGLDTSGLPPQFTPEVGEQLQMFASLLEMPQDQRTEFERLLGALPEDQRREAMMVKLGMAPSADARMRSTGGGTKPPSSVQEYEYARQQGYEGTFQDWQKDKRGSGISFTTPDGSTLQIGGGVPGDAPVANRTEAIKGHNAFQSIMKGLDDWEATVQETGSAVLPGAERDALHEMRRNLQLQMKELYNLGVLNGPDLALMDQLLLDPTSLVNAGMDAVGVADIRERSRANVERLRKMMKDLVEPKLRSVGGSLGSEGSGFDVKTLSDDQLREMLGL